MKPYILEVHVGGTAYSRSFHAEDSMREAFQAARASMSKSNGQITHIVLWHSNNPVHTCRYTTPKPAVLPTADANGVRRFPAVRKSFLPPNVDFINLLSSEEIEI